MIESLHATAFGLARQHGTPLFVYSRDRPAGAASKLDGFVKALPFPAEAYFSYKTNYLPELCRHAASLGLGAEVTSPIEWDLASTMHAPGRIIVNGIGKLADDLLPRLLRGAPPRLINIETDTEIETILGSEQGASVPVGLRVCIPRLSGERGLDPSEHWQRGTSKFGWTANGAAVIVAARSLAANPRLRLEALHLHLGSQVVSPRFYDTALREVCRLLERVRAVGVTTVNTLDIGGGLASGWVGKRRRGPLFQTLRAAGLPSPAREQREPDLDGIAAVFHRHAGRMRSLGIERLVLEPGRLIAEPAMVAVTKVLAVRRDGARSHVIVDIGTNALHCWRGNERRNIVFEDAGDRPQHMVEVSGPLCHRSDTFGRVSAPPDLAPGALVCLDAVGAYSLGDWIANAWARPAVVDTSGNVLWAGQDPAEFFEPASHRPVQA